MLLVNSFENGFRNGDGHFVLKAVDNDSLCCKQQQQQTIYQQSKKDFTGCESWKNDESNGTTVYIDNSLEINRDIRKRRKIRKIVNRQAPL